MGVLVRKLEKEPPGTSPGAAARLRVNQPSTLGCFNICLWLSGFVRARMDLGPHTGFHGREYNVRLTYVI